MPDKPAITSSELGILWLTYQQITMLLRVLEYFIEKADDEKARTIMTDLYKVLDPNVAKIQNILQSEGAVVPIGFMAQDVNKGVPKLYDNGFDIMFIRLLKEIGMGMHTLNITMAYREDIILYFKELTVITQEAYNACTQYLLEKGMLARPPYVSMPQSVMFVQDAKYLSGLNPFTKKRPLNTIEVANLYHAIESNTIGIQMITGFAQCANESEVKKFFSEGLELAKSFVADLTNIFLQSDIQAPNPSGGNATLSTLAPFSDKLMLYCTSLFCSFSMGSGAVGTAFSLRNDLPLKISIFMKDIYEYAHKGGKLMIKNGWMEEPPQMADRKQLTNA